MRTNNRNPYFDFLRGIVILMVVGIHTYPGNFNFKNGISYVFQIILINTFNCAVPLFLAISGYFIARKRLRTFTECGVFWRKQIPIVYVLCLVFSIPWLILHCLSVNGSILLIINNLLTYFLCGYSIYYFIALIIQCHFLAPLLVRYNNKQTLILVSSVSVIATCFLEYVRFSHGYELPLIMRGSFIILLCFFYIGVYLSRRSRDNSLALPVLMMVVGLLLGLYQMVWLQRAYGTMQVGQKVTLYLFDAGFILFCMSCKAESWYRDNTLTRMILRIGEISFGIYFTHIYIINLADRFFPTMRCEWLLLWTFTIILTIAVIFTVKRIAPGWSHRFLGYR